jgi:ABC-2 type transport system permease protein
MNANLFKKEMRFNASSLLIWSLIISFLICMTMSVYPTFIKNQSKVMGMMSLMPKSALQFKGISNLSDLMSVLGFYGMNNIIYMMVLGSVFSMVLACNVLLKEEYNKTAEYLLTRPVKRSTVFFTKLAVIVLNVLILNIVASLAGYISMKIVNKGAFPFSAFLILSLYTLMLNMLFGAIGLFMSMLMKKARPITTLGIGVVLVLYFIFTISKITESASKLGFLSPFKYVRTDVLAVNYSLGPWHLLYFCGLSILLVFLAYSIYIKKDIYT